MLEKLLLPEKHAIAILIKDHDTVKDLFDRFEKAESAAEKEKIISAALSELKIHGAIEEELFYPAVRKHVGSDLMNEADEEHHVARVLVAELEQDDRGDDHRHAKFTVLAESVRHHIKEEESEVLPKAKGVEIDFEALGVRMLERKRELHKNGIPPDAEHKMVASMNDRGDSPAAHARRTGATASAGSRRKMKTPTRSVRSAGKQSKKSRTRTAARAKSSQTR